jgi:hypothetical protein
MVDLTMAFFWRAVQGRKGGRRRRRQPERTGFQRGRRTLAGMHLSKSGGGCWWSQRTDGGQRTALNGAGDSCGRTASLPTTAGQAQACSHQRLRSGKTNWPLGTTPNQEKVREDRIWTPSPQLVASKPCPAQPRSLPAQPWPRLSHNCPGLGRSTGVTVCCHLGQSGAAGAPIVACWAAAPVASPVLSPHKSR